jgi:hypothetical protein
MNWKFWKRSKKDGLAKHQKVVNVDGVSLDNSIDDLIAANQKLGLAQNEIKQKRKEIARMIDAKLLGGKNG